MVMVQLPTVIVVPPPTRMGPGRAATGPAYTADVTGEADGAEGANVA
jgi:hypothetical protein